MQASDMLERFPMDIKSYSCEAIDPQSFKGIALCGMGGSGIVGDFMKVFLERSELEIPVLSLKGYTLPAYIQEGWLVICTSYSGNTEETISVLKEALKRGIKPICISSGGELYNLASQNSLTHIMLPEGYPPRFALGFMLSALMSLFDMHSEIALIKDALEKHKSEIKEQAKVIAHSHLNYIPIIYATPITEPVALRWRTQHNENSKTLCYHAILPEMHHNEVVGLENQELLGNLAFCVLYDPQDHPRVIKRVKITQSLLQEKGIMPRLLAGKGTSIYERLLYLTYLGDWISYYLAGLYKKDPLPVEVIDFIKKSL
ncbi:MAG: bifunctional phosphoglucose/phosphomannose isomerase [Aquificaceae bacterium]|nr:bifunctional phosphoglucose/phosphomannose isomerase [Aquificaceae bacterium]